MGIAVNQADAGGNEQCAQEVIPQERLLQKQECTDRRRRRLNDIAPAVDAGNSSMERNVRR